MYSISALLQRLEPPLIKVPVHRRRSGGGFLPRQTALQCVHLPGGQRAQGRRAVKPEHFEEYGRQNGLFFLKAGCVMAVIGALDALVTLDALLYLLLYVFGFAFAFYPLTRWCKANEGFSWPWPHVKSEKKRIRELRKEQEQQKKK